MKGIQIMFLIAAGVCAAEGIMRFAAPDCRLFWKEREIAGENRAGAEETYVKSRVGTEVIVGGACLCLAAIYPKLAGLPALGLLLASIGLCFAYSSAVNRIILGKWRVHPGSKIEPAERIAQGVVSGLSVVIMMLGDFSFISVAAGMLLLVGGTVFLTLRR